MAVMAVMEDRASDAFHGPNSTAPRRVHPPPRPYLRFDQATIGRLHYRLRAGSRTELLSRVVNVKVYGSLQEPENLRDFSRRLAACNPGQCFHFTGGEIPRLRPQLHARPPSQASRYDGGQDVEIDRLGHIVVGSELSASQLVVGGREGS